jgi:hypothetical protein
MPDLSVTDAEFGRLGHSCIRFRELERHLEAPSDRRSLDTFSENTIGDRRFIHIGALLCQTLRSGGARRFRIEFKKRHRRLGAASGGSVREHCEKNESPHYFVSSCKIAQRAVARVLKPDPPIFPTKCSSITPGLMAKRST